MRIEDVNFRLRAKVRSLRGEQSKKTVNRELHIVGGQGAPIVELDVLAKFERVHESVG
jgi:hypothetical protein